MGKGVHTTPSVIIRIILWIVLLVGGAAMGIWLDLHYFKELFLNPLFHAAAFAAGLFMMKYAFRAAGNGGRELARSGKSGDIPRLETNRLATTGVYAQMRHPMLFGLTLVPPALALMIGSPSFILYIAPAEMAFIIFMVLTLEERECRHKFGKDYENYAARVPAICIRPSCLRTLFGKIDQKNRSSSQKGA